MAKSIIACALLLAPAALAQSVTSAATYRPAPTFVPGELGDCAKDCATKYDQCRSARPNGLSANQAQCASEYASCLKFNPFTNPGVTFTTPNACAPTSVTNSVTSYRPAPTFVPGALGDCAKDCANKYDQCRSARPNGLSANQAQCASEYASCLRFNPFEVQTASTFSTPNACAPSSATDKPTTTAPAPAYATGDAGACAKDCATKYDQCRSARPNGLSANQAQCASEYASCLKFNPFTNPGVTFTTPTACATGSSAPAPGTATSTIVNPPATATSLVTASASQPAASAPAPAATSVAPVLNNGAGSMSPANLLWLGLGLFML